MANLELIDYTDIRTFPMSNFNDKNGDDMTYQVTRDDLTDIKKEMMSGFSTLTIKLDSMQGQYTSLIVEQTAMKKDIQALQTQINSYDLTIKGIVGTIVSIIITAILALVMKN